MLSVTLLRPERETTETVEDDDGVVMHISEGEPGTLARIAAMEAAAGAHDVHGLLPGTLVAKLPPTL